MQSFRKFTEIIDIPDISTVYGSPTSFAHKSKLPLRSIQSQALNINTRTEYDLRPQPKNFFDFFSIAFYSG